MSLSAHWRKHAFDRGRVVVWSDHTAIPDGVVFVVDAGRKLAKWMVENS